MPVLSGNVAGVDERRALRKLTAAAARVLRIMERDILREYDRRTASLTADASRVNPDGLVDEQLWRDTVNDELRGPIGAVLAEAGEAVDVGDLFRDNGPDFDRLVNRHMAELEARGGALDRSIANVVARAATEGDSVVSLRKQIQETGALSRSAANRIAQTELVSAVNGGAMASYRAQGVPLIKEWLATPDSRTRDDHVAANGQRVPLDTPFSVGGDIADHPGDPALSAGQRVNCRCTMIVEAADQATASRVRGGGLLSLAFRESLSAMDLSQLGTQDAREGAMIALIPEKPLNLAADIPGALKAEDMHLTLMYLGKAADIDETAVSSLRSRAEGLANLFEPMELNIFASSEFNGGSPNACACGLVAANDQLLQLRDFVMSDFENASGHLGFIPHVTFGYRSDVGAGETYDSLRAHVDKLQGTPINFTMLRLSIGANDFDFPLAAPPQPPSPSEELPMSDQSLVADAAVASTEPEPGRFSGVIALENTETGDGRFFPSGAFKFDTESRPLPLTLMVMLRNPDGGGGHDAAEIAGRIDNIWREGNSIMASGFIDLAGEAGAEAHRLMVDKILRGVSVDMSDLAVEFVEDETHPMGGQLVYETATIMGATLLAFPAIGATGIVLDTEQENGLVASAGGASDLTTATFPWAHTAEEAQEQSNALVASVSQLASPVAVTTSPPPSLWFQKFDAQHMAAEYPVLKEAPSIVTGDGRILGRLARWNDQHTGVVGRRQNPPRSRCNYEKFRTGTVLTESGDFVATGRIFLGGDHAPGHLGVKQTLDWYANAGEVVGDVVVYEDEFGLNVAGYVRPGITEAMLTALRASDLSPDWRRVNGNLEMIGILCVNASGFIPGALCASANIPNQVSPRAFYGTSDDGEAELLSLVASGIITKADYVMPEIEEVVDRLTLVEQQLGMDPETLRRDRMDAALASLGLPTASERIEAALTSMGYVTATDRISAAMASMSS